MAVIINDFEIQVEPPAAQTGQTGQQGQGEQQGGQAATPPLRPLDIEQIMQHVEQRRLRLLAD